MRARLNAYHFEYLVSVHLLKSYVLSLEQGLSLEVSTVSVLLVRVMSLVWPNLNQEIGSLVQLGLSS